MIAADSSALSSYFKGEIGIEIQKVDDALATGALRLPPVVLTEVLSDPELELTLSPLS